MDGCCIVSMPVLIYIEHRQKQVMATKLQELCPDRDLPASQDDHRFLATVEPRHTSATTIIRALTMADIHRVDILAYGMQAHHTHFGYLDRLLTFYNPTPTFPQSPLTSEPTPTHNPSKFSLLPLIQQHHYPVASSRNIHFYMGARRTVL